MAAIIKDTFFKKVGDDLFEFNGCRYSKSQIFEQAVNQDLAMISLKDGVLVQHCNSKPSLSLVL